MRPVISHVFRRQTVPESGGKEDAGYFFHDSVENRAVRVVVAIGRDNHQHVCRADDDAVSEAAVAFLIAADKDIRVEWLIRDGVPRVDRRAALPEQGSQIGFKLFFIHIFSLSSHFSNAFLYRGEKRNGPVFGLIILRVPRKKML
nr:MAG TPA: hypothetical protein [Caudoviricetes sp.]